MLQGDLVSELHIVRDVGQKIALIAWLGFFHGKVYCYYLIRLFTSKHRQQLNIHFHMRKNTCKSMMWDAESFKARGMGFEGQILLALLTARLYLLRISRYRSQLLVDFVLLKTLFLRLASIKFDRLPLINFDVVQHSVALPSRTAARSRSAVSWTVGTEDPISPSVCIQRRSSRPS